MADERPVIVVTGAGAGAARCIAERFGREGWRVGLISRSEERLDDARVEIERLGGEAIAVPCDVSDCAAVFRARDQVLDSSAVVSPLQSAYCACKFAIRGFTDSLRTELKHERSKITVTMLQMPGMNTPQFDWARNKLPNDYQPVGEVFDPDVAAEAAWRAVKQGPRELWVGGSAVEAISGQMIAPRALDRMMATQGWDGQIAPEPNTHETDNLFAPAPGRAGARGRFGSRSKPKALIVDPDRARLGVGAASAAAAVGVAGAALALGARIAPRRR